MPTARGGQHQGLAGIRRGFRAGRRTVRSGIPPTAASRRDFPARAASDHRLRAPGAARIVLSLFDRYRATARCRTAARFTVPSRPCTSRRAAPTLQPDVRTPMSTHSREHDRFQLWCLMELAGSATALLDAERELSLLLGRKPELYELVDELVARRHRAGAEALVEA
jgi:hypothetical protein